MTILFVLENYYPKIGGVETFFKSLTDTLSAHGHTCIVITTWPGGSVPHRESTERIKIIRIRTVSRYLFTVFAFIPVVRQLSSCDLVHTTSYNAALPAFLATRFVRRKVLITFHEVWGKLWFRLPLIGFFGKWGHYLFEQLILRLRFDRFVAVSKYTAERLEASGVYPDRINVIYPGIDYRHFEKTDFPLDFSQRTGPAAPAAPEPAAPAAPVFVYTYYGRLGLSKGLDILLNAAIEIKRLLPNSRLQLILPTQPKAMYLWVRKFIDTHQLHNHVLLRHHLPFEDLKAAIRASDCVVIPSYSEGFCFVAAEAIALGTPVISSDQAALKEVIGGRFIKMRAFDSKALVDAILQAHRGEWEEEPVKRFELEKTVEEYMDCYEEILNVE